ncbi:TolC family protein [Chlorobium sp. N1]|uniref:TolC family protein n=1 Tax=Chlorobium sp. N1 TaxID=2491138 RepID=UPI0013F16593|nr:TolC family protein [Chlorobium sp. N1]
MQPGKHSGRYGSARKHSRALWLAAALFLPAVPLQAQDAAEQGISLLGSVRTGLTYAPAVQSERREVLKSEASLTEARSTYDPSLTLSSGYRKDAGLAESGSNRHTLSSSLALSQRLPSGITLAPTLSLVRRSTNLEGTTAETEGSAGMSIVVPLSRGLGSRNLSRATRNAARQSLEAEQEQLVATLATSAYRTASAYWDYVYACSQLDLAHLLTQSARHQLNATRVLAEADQIARLMVEQADAYLQQSRASELSAALALEERWHALLLAMGQDPADYPVPAKPSDDFPVPENDFPAGLPSLETLRRAALRNRSDLRSEALATAAAATTLEGYRNEQKPDVSLTLWGGYGGTSAGDEVGDYFTALNHNIPGTSLSASLSWAIEGGNRANQAAFQTRLAMLEQRRIEEAALQRSVGSGVATALSSVRNAAALYRLNLVSAEAYGRLKEGEMKKFRMGLSDIFNLQTASNNLASADLQLLAAKKAFAQAILDLRMATGSLVEVTDGSVRLTSANLVSLPTEEEGRP